MKRFAPLAVAVAAAAAITLAVPATASTGVFPCLHDPSAKTAAHQSLAAFAAANSTDPVSVIGMTYRCEQLPGGFAAYVNAARWHRPLPAGILLYWTQPGSQS